MNTEKEEVKNEIVVDNALYEAIIMASVPKNKIPVCENCHGEEDYSGYQKNFREKRGKRWKEEHTATYILLKDFFEKLDSEIIDNYVLENIRTSTLIRPERLIRTFLGVLNDEKTNDFKKYGEVSLGLQKPNTRRAKIAPYSLNAITARQELCDLYHELTQTFEVQRLKRILMTGVFPYVRSSSTHTRFSHCEGTWILGWYALTDMKVDDKPLIDFLAEEDLHREFMAALILHDIGHAPFSHVIELNPYIDYDHEEKAKKMILGQDVHYILHDILAESIYYNRDTLYNWFGITLEDLNDLKNKYQNAYKLVHHVIVNLGLDPCTIVELFHKGGKETKDPAIKMLRTLISGVIDLDRLDHIYRDIHFSSYARSQPSVRALFNGFNFHYEKEVEIGKDPFLEISKNVVPNIKSLFEAREVTARLYKGNIENNFYIGLLNMAIADAVRINKLLEDMLPFITDEGLLYFLTDREQFSYPRAMDTIRKFHSSKNQYEKYIGKVYQIRSKFLEMPSKIIEDLDVKDLFELFEDSFEDVIFSTALMKHSGTEYTFSEECIDIKIGDKCLGKTYETFLNGLNDTVVDERNSLLHVYFYKNSECEEDLKKKIENKIFQGMVELKEHKK